MPITIKTGSLKFKDPDTEKYVGIDVAAETKASQQLASIEAAGEAQVASITQNGEAQMADITENGESQMTDITQNGQVQVAAIQTAGQTQVSNIETKGAETLDSIPDDYTDLYNEVGDLKSALLTEKSTYDYVSTPDVVDTVKEIDADGDIVASQFSNLKIWGFAIDGTYTGVGFNVINGNAKYIAFYSAENYAGCSSLTFISKVQYTNSSTNEIPFPAGATYCLINYRTFNSGYFYLKEIVTAASVELDEFAASLNTQIGNTMNLADLAVFSRGKVNSDGTIDTTSLYRCVNSTILDIDRAITLSYDNTTYKVTVYYYDAGGTIGENNGALVTFDALTILAGSHVRIVIEKRNSTVALTDSELVSLPKAITFDTAIKDWRDTVDENCGFESLCAKMYEKGGSPKSFDQSVGIIVAGQSNIDGRVPKATLPDTITPPFANIKNSINSTTGSFASSMSLPTNFGIDFSMYAALNELNENIYVMKWAQGDTSISPDGNGSKHWTPFYEKLDSISNSLLYSFETQIRKCMESNPNTFDIRAFVWQQGEGDWATEITGSKKASLDYYENFKCLVAYVRGIVGNERLPVICGTVSHNSGQYDPRVEAATLKVASEDPYMTCIDMSEATLLDSYHFDTDSAVYFGYKAYDALIDFGVVSGTKINPTPPWED